MSHKELPLFIHWNKTLKYILNKTEKFPKRVRFTFSSRIDNLALNLIEKIIEARYTKNKTEILKSINLELEKLRVLFSLCNELGYLDCRGYEHVSNLVDEAGRMAFGWKKQQENK